MASVADRVTGLPVPAVEVSAREMTAAATSASIALPAYAQSEEAGRQNAAVQVFGSFVTTTTHNGSDNSATHSGGVLATYRYFFSTHSGVEANYGYALNTQSYLSPSSAVGVKPDQIASRP